MEFENIKNKCVLLVMAPDKKYSNSVELNNTNSVLGAKLILIYLQSLQKQKKAVKRKLEL